MQGCNSIVSFAVTKLSPRVTVSNHKPSRGTVLFFFSSKADGRKVGTTVPTGLCMPIILCIPLTYTDLAVEQKRSTPQVKFVKLQMFGEFSIRCVEAFWFLRNEERRKCDRKTKKKHTGL